MVFILNYLFALSTKDFIKGPPEGTQGFYLFLILFATTKAGKDSHTRMFQTPAIEDAEPAVEHPLPPPSPLEPLPLPKSEPGPPQPPEPPPLPMENV
jgi:hypothetical protein